MKIGFKRVLIGLLTIIVLALVGVAIFLMTLDPNAYKGKIQAWAYERYQRTLTIEGDLQISLFPRIALAAQDVRLSERQSDDNFVSIDSARFAVAIWPLLFDRFVVDHVSVSGFRATVLRDENGQFNFGDLLGLRPPEASTEAETVPQAGRSDASGGTLDVDIAGLELKDGEILYADQASGQTAQLGGLQISTGRVTFGQPFDVSFNATLKGEAPAIDATVSGQAQVKLDPGQASYSAQRLNLQVSGRVSDLNANVLSARGNVAYDGVSRMVEASQVEWRLEGEWRGERPIGNIDLSLAVPRFKVDRSRLEFLTEKLTLRASAQLPRGELTNTVELAVDAPQLSISPEQARGQPVQATFKHVGERTLGVSMRLEGLGGHARQLLLKSARLEAQLKTGDQLTQLVMTSPVEWNADENRALLSAIKGDVRINDAYLPSGSFEFPFIGSLHVGEAGLNGDLNAVLSGTPLNFTLGLTQWQAPKWQFALQADALDIDKLLPPVPPASQAVVQPGEQQAEAQGQAQAQPQVETPAPDSAGPPAGAAAQATEDSAGPAANPSQADRADQAKVPADAGPQPADAPGTERAGRPRGGFRWLENLDLAGKIDIGQLKGRGLEATAVKAQVQAQKGRLTIDGLSAQLYQGTMTGRFSVDAESAITGRLSLKGVEAEPFSRVAGLGYPLTGKASLDADLKTQGDTLAARIQQLSGTVRLRIQPGAIQGVDIEGALSDLGQAVQASLAGRKAALPTRIGTGGQTAFSSLVLNAAVKQGVVQVRELGLQSALFRVSQGKPATVDLVEQHIDLLLNVRVTGSLKSPDGSKTVNVRGLTIPVRISGPLAQPGYQVQWERLGGRLAEQALKRGLLDMLSGKGGRDEELLEIVRPPQPGSGPATPGAQNPEETLRGLGDALKSILKP